MRDRAVDVCVVGAGPAGAFAAVELARRGRTVALVTGEHGPLRLETLTTPAIRLLLDAGLGDVLALASITRIARTTMHWRVAPETRAFDAMGPVLVSRPRFDRLLVEAAGMHRVSILRGARARRIEASGGAGEDAGARVELADGSVLAATVVVDAAGRRASFRSRPRHLTPAVAAVGFSGTAGRTPAASTQLEAHQDGWCWWAHLSNGRIHGIVVTDPAQLPGQRLESRRRFVADRVGRGWIVEPGFVCEAGLVAATVNVDGCVIRIGDAALARDPISSHGLAQALQSASTAAVAINTLLEPGGDRDAVATFLARRFEQSVAEATAATVRAYAEQRRFPGAPFWTSRAGAPAAIRTDATEDMPAAPCTMRIDPGATLVREAVLDHDRIVWGQALVGPRKGRATAFFGGVPASVVRAAIIEPGTATELAARLAVAGVSTPGVIDELWNNGVLMVAGER